LNGNKKSIDRYGAKGAAGNQSCPVAALPVNFIPVKDIETKKHGYATAEKHHFHTRHVTQLFNQHIHKSKAEGAEKHVFYAWCKKGLVFQNSNYILPQISKEPKDEYKRFLNIAGQRIFRHYFFGRLPKSFTSYPCGYDSFLGILVRSTG